MPKHSSTVCYRQCCFQEEKCLHSPDPVFRPSCGRDKHGGQACPEHAWAKLPPPEPLAKPAFEWEGTAHRVPSALEFKSTYENDVRVLCAVVMSNTFVRLGLPKLDLSDWAASRFIELTAASWKPHPSDVRNTLIQLGYLKEDAP